MPVETASAIESSGSIAASCEKGTAMVRSFQRIKTSLSAEQAASGAMRWTSTVSPFLRGENYLGRDAVGLKKELDFGIEVAMPPPSARWRPRLVMDTILPDRISLAFLHDCAPKIRRTDVLPIRILRAIC